MTTASVVHTERKEAVEYPPERRPKAYLGFYMPFFGVRYYAMFDETDVARGNTKIGPVGWTLHETPEKEPNKRKALVGVAA